MAIIEVVETMPRSGGVNKVWQRTYTRTFRVVTNNPTDSAYIARLATDPNTGLTIPSIGNYWYVSATDKDFGSFVESIECRLMSASANPSESVWEVTCNYGPYEALPQDPTQWPLRIDWGEAADKKSVIVDINGNAIVNSAGDPFKDSIEIDDNRTVLTVVQNMLTYDPQVAGNYRGHLNVAAFAGFAPKTVLCTNITASLRFDKNAGGGTGEGSYYEVTFIFQINEKGWDRKILDRGFNYLVSGTVTPITNDGQPPSEPMLLNGSGGILAVGGTPAFVNYDVYPTADFSVFGFNFVGAPGQNSDEAGSGGTTEGGGGGDLD